MILAHCEPTVHGGKDSGIGGDGVVVSGQR